MKIPIENILEERTFKVVDGESDKWVWLKEDDGAWSGPTKDWESSHQHKYFTHVKNFDCVVTAGANLGLHVRAYAKKFKTVYAFEPHWLNFYCMSINAPYSNVIKMNAALGKEPGFCKVNDNHKTNVGMFTVNEIPDGIIPIMTIDGLNLQKCDLIQLDVEGFEPQVIQGAKETIDKFKPVVIMERIDEGIKVFLHGLGYEEKYRSKMDYVFALK